VVRLAIWRGMFKDSVRRTCGHLATAEVKYHTHILCVKDEYAVRINGMLCVAFYQQYRIWPGERFTPCLEMISPSGKARSYPIARNTKYNAIPEVRTNVDQTVIWFVDNPGLSKAYRYGGVWCSLNRVTGEFVGAEGPYPAGVSETSGFPLFWPCSSPQLPFQYRVGVSDIHL
jgi:hypothetical protein